MKVTVLAGLKYSGLAAHPYCYSADANLFHSYLNQKQCRMLNVEILQ